MIHGFDKKGRGLFKACDDEYALLIKLIGGQAVFVQGFVSMLSLYYN